MIGMIMAFMAQTTLCDRCQHSEVTPIVQASVIAAKRVGVKEETPQLVALIEREHGYSVDFESRFSTNRASGAYGLGQFMPKTWAGVGITKTDCQVCQIEGIYRYCRYRREYGSVSRALQKWDARATHGRGTDRPRGGWY